VKDEKEKLFILSDLQNFQVSSICLQLSKFFIISLTLTIITLEREKVNSPYKMDIFYLLSDEKMVGAFFLSS